MARMTDPSQPSELVVVSGPGAEPAAEALLALRPRINALRTQMDQLVTVQDANVQRNLAGFAEDTRRQTWVVVIAMAASLALAIGCIALLIRNLTEPLARAVSLARKTAAGHFAAETAAPDPRHDIGGLLASLVAMRERLQGQFHELARNEARLANAQRMAAIGDWEFDIATASLTMSDSTAWPRDSRIPVASAWAIPGPLMPSAIRPTSSTAAPLRS